MANSFDDPATPSSPISRPGPPPRDAGPSRTAGAVAGGLVGALVAGGVGSAAGHLAADDEPTARRRSSRRRPAH